MRLKDKPNAWMHASNSSSTVADCSDNGHSMVPSFYEYTSPPTVWLESCVNIETDEKK